MPEGFFSEYPKNHMYEPFPEYDDSDDDNGDFLTPYGCGTLKTKARARTRARARAKGFIRQKVRVKMTCLGLTTPPPYNHSKKR